MKTIESNTNIMCGSFVAKLTPTFNEIIGENKWKVDSQKPKKVLSVISENLNEADAIRAVEKTGYKAEKLS